jgi:4-amino-4-deoxy-L-arabinose transferase-like glycosyltransferase
VSDVSSETWVLAAAALLLFVGPGWTDFWPPDEPRAGAIAEEMRSLVHGWRDLVVLHLNGEIYTQKPPLFHWLAALFGAFVRRVTESVARLPSANAGFLTVALACHLGRTLFRPRVGVLAGVLLLAVPSFVQLARSARLDALLTLLVMGAFAAAWRLDRGIRAERTNRALLHGAIGLGVLTRGPSRCVPGVRPARLGAASLRAWPLRVAREPAALARSGSRLGRCGLDARAKRLRRRRLWDNFARSSHARPWWFYLERFPLGVLPLTLLWPRAWLRFRALARDPAAAEALRAWRFLLAPIGAVVVLLSAGNPARSEPAQLAARPRRSGGQRDAAARRDRAVPSRPVDRSTPLPRGPPRPSVGRRGGRDAVLRAGRLRPRDRGRGSRPARRRVALPGARTRAHPAAAHAGAGSAVMTRAARALR